MECKKQGKDFWGEMGGGGPKIYIQTYCYYPNLVLAETPIFPWMQKRNNYRINIHTKPEEIYRAILEGMAFQMYLAYERMNVIGTKMKRLQQQEADRFRSDLQIRADVFGMEVYSMESEEAGTLGCMLMSAVATGAYKSLKAGIKRQ